MSHDKRGRAILHNYFVDNSANVRTMKIRKRPLT